METLEEYYMKLSNDTDRIKMPLCLKYPSGSLFVDKISATNDIVQVFSELNKICRSLGRDAGKKLIVKGIRFQPFVEAVRDEETTKEQRVRILAELSDIFNTKKGEIYTAIQEKLRKFKEA